MRGSQTLMAKMKAMTAKPLSSYSHEWKVLPQQLVAIAPDASRKPPLPEGMVGFPAALSSSASQASRSKAATTSASTCSIRGKIRRAASTNTP